MSKVIMGIDLGLHSLAIAVLEGGRITHCFQAETPRNRRVTVPDETERWKRIISGAITDARPSVVGIEDFEPQPWKTGGRIPKGATKMQALVSDIRSACQLRGCIVYTQSPSVTDVDQGVLDALIRKAMGRGYKPTAHLRDALAHAFAAESTWRRERLQDA